MSSDQEKASWIWKEEPASPSETSSLDIDDDWLSFESKENIDSNGDQVMYEEQTSRAQVATKLLEELDEWIKEEPYSDWLEQKIDLPIFEELSPSEYGINQPSLSLGQTKVHQPNQESTRTLQQEFESLQELVLGDVEACRQATTVAALTPPQSPPAKFYDTSNAQILITLQPALHALTIPLAKPRVRPSPCEPISTSADTEPALQWSAENISLEPLGDVDSELALVDEFVRSCANDISPSSPPCTSSETSCGSSEDSNDDPEWTPVASSTASVSTPSTSQKSRHRKPYSRPSNDDRKVRKKEQNKNAATRYRQKKKQEIKEIVGEEQELMNYNEKLQGQVSDLQREVRYLKGLMRDLFKAKGLLK
ncbi:activating transcription factor of chaperone isoform X2 [Athalia rosae]|uniref:activating transcription factor of chaperone isoform X2 n=1 Tax=Athalia rosae TaxID=37344 RepID=UPI0020336162|nr:activating transcription factor of chaperone isoform X2 [Athalia rosae]